MAERTDTVRIPFKLIEGLPPKAQWQIRRDFEELARSFGSTSDFFDAIIDPTLSASDPDNRIYINVSECLYDLATTSPLIIGVKNTLTTITEPTTGPAGSTEYLPALGPVALVSFGQQPTGSDWRMGSHPVWDLSGRYFPESSTATVYIRGLHIKSSIVMRGAAGGIIDIAES